MNVRYTFWVLALSTILPKWTISCFLPVKVHGTVAQRRDIFCAWCGCTSENQLPRDNTRRSVVTSVVLPISTCSLVLVSGKRGEAISGTLADVKDVPPITHKVFLDVRIARSDGTFYVRDDLPDKPENEVYYGRIILELFGTLAPTHVSEFLKYVDVVYNPLDDDPLPTYGRSLFTGLNQATGLLEGGYIPGLEVTTISGSSAIRYGGRVLPAKLWIEKDKVEKKISHSTKGLLTHRSLDGSPSFGITTRGSPELDATHFVFGRVVPDDNMNEFLLRCEELPTYSLDRPAVATPGESSTSESRATEELASKVYATQRKLFRDAAKSLGDTRLGKVYEGKLLRKVEVTKVGLL